MKRDSLFNNTLAHWFLVHSQWTVASASDERYDVEWEGNEWLRFSIASLPHVSECEWFDRLLLCYWSLKDHGALGQWLYRLSRTKNIPIILRCSAPWSPWSTCFYNGSSSLALVPYSRVLNKNGALIRVMGRKNLNILIRVVPWMRVLDSKIEIFPVTVSYRQNKKKCLYLRLR